MNAKVLESWLARAENLQKASNNLDKPVEYRSKAYQLLLGMVDRLEILTNELEKLVL